MNKKKENAIRYRLHSLVRKNGFKLITKNKTIYHKNFDDILSNKHLNRLINEFGYVVQLEIC